MHLTKGALPICRLKGQYISTKTPNLEALGRLASPHLVLSYERTLLSALLMIRLLCRRASSIKDHYALLELQPGASEQDVKQAYARLALLYHPGEN